MKLSRLPRNCPKCGSSHVHRSRRRSLIEGLLSYFGGEIRRCHDCLARRCWFGTTALPLARAFEPDGIRSAGIVLSTAFLSCAVVIWWTITRLPRG